MHDNALVDLYNNRDESAITRTAEQYGAYCFTIAFDILGNKQDADECVNDAYLNAWNAIPPAHPDVFPSFIGRITRNISLNKYKSKKTHKRAGNETAVLLSELEGCIPARGSVEENFDSKLLGAGINKFLSAIERDDRVIFMRRYWYNDSIKAIAERFGVSESLIASNLFRTRKKLKLNLEKEGLL
jgi:RNA polymerase sigma-70 factor (ECF subfamily)